MKREFLFIAVCLLANAVAVCQVNLNQGLVAYYPFSGNTNDASGNNNNGTPYNGVQLTTDRFGNPNSAYYFDGVDDYIQVLNAPSLNPSSAISVALLFNPQQNGVQTLIGKIGYAPGLGTQFQIAMDFSLEPGVLFGVNPFSNDCLGVPLNASYANTGSPIITDQWYCVVGTFDNGTLSIYLNGVLIETVTTGFSNLNQCNNADIQIGSWWLGDLQRFRGKIDEVRIYNRALNSQEVAALCNVPTTLCTGSLGDPVVNIDFGSGNNPGPAIPSIIPGASSTHSYVAVNGNPATPTPIDGQYTVTNNVPLNGAWFSGMPDHTPGDVNGYMAFYNSQELAGLEFYRQTIGNLCGSTTYEFAAWVANCLSPFVLNGVDPNITFRIEKTDGSLIASYNTGPIPESSTFTWKQFGFYFTMPPGETSVVLKMINNSVGGNILPGNDLAIDDITFRPCGPATNASFDANTQVDSATVCEGQQQSLYGSLSTGFANPSYRWQFSSDNGQSWSDITSSNNLQFNFITSVTGQTRFIKLRMVAAEGSNINSVNCRVVSNSIVLKIIPQVLCNRPYIGTPISGIINAYTPVTAWDPCTNTLTVGDAAAFNVGDTIILIQMKGAVIDSSNSASFGTISNYGNAGNYEYNYVLQKNGNSITLRNEMLRTYDIPGGVVQLVRVPYYINATVVNELTAQTWNGSTGGILALTIRDTLLISANIDVSGKGFSGGRANNSRSLVTNCNQNDYNYPAGSPLAAAKGESIATISGQISHGKGAPANGGGGGLDHNSGGGGGGNGGAGGLGGYQLEACTGSSFDNRGIGGKNLAYSNAANKVFLGGGGGAGHSNQPNGIEMDGGNGGGIMIIRAGTIYNDGNRILAKGNNGTFCNLPNLDNCHDGNGGGGGGGSILIEAASYTASTTLDVRGGKGADLVIFNNFGGGRIGPGGGGGGGVVWISPLSPESQLNILNQGGARGVILLDNNNPWGTSDGQNGLNLLGLRLPVSVILFRKNIDSVTLADSIVNCRDVRFNGDAQTRRVPLTNWQWSFGDGNSSNSSNPSTNHTYSQGGTYLAKLVVTDTQGCKDSTTTTVTVDTVSANIDPVATTCINIPLTLQGRGGPNYSWSPGRFLNDSTLQNPIATISTTTLFVLTVSNNLNCVDTASVWASVHPKPLFNSPNAPASICKGSPAQLNGNNGNTYSYNWSPASSLNDPRNSNPIASPDTSTTYFLTVTEPVCNYDSSFQVRVIVNPLPDVIASKSNDIDCSVRTAQLFAQGANSYTWSPAGGIDNPNIANPVVRPETSTLYTVTGRNEFGCLDSDTVSVKVTNDGKSVFEVPNAFTPNGDGKNDCFGIRRWGNVTVKEFSIYNRWGQVVFSTKNPTVCWDGTVNGKAQDPGGFVYVIKAASACGEITKTGIVTLVR